MSDKYVVEESESPVVFSDSPDSPAAEFLVEESPESLSDLYRLGIIHASIPEEDLRDIQRSLEQMSVPDVLFSESNLGLVSSREIKSVITIPRNVVVMREVISRATGVLIARGHSPAIAKLTAEKAAPFLSPFNDSAPVWKEIRIPNLDLEVRGLLYLKHAINAVSARNVYFHKYGWIVPESTHFLLTCNELTGVTDNPLVIPLVAEVMATPGPHPPVEGFSDRLSISEIRARVEVVTAGWR